MVLCGGLKIITLNNSTLAWTKYKLHLFSKSSNTGLLFEDYLDFI